jgi:GNAT superfamily N-acetyltransferase
MMTSSTVTISRYTGGADDALHAIWEATVASLHPAYTLSTTKMSQLLGADNAVTFVAREGDSDAILGYTLTYTIRAGAVEPASQHLKGTLSILAVARDAQGRGVGSALHDAALEHLTSVVRGSLSRSTPPAADSTISLGSIFPRVFPGLPVLDAFKPARAWFERRGWVFDANTSIDLYGKLPNDVDLDKFKEQAHSHSIVFRPAKPEDEEKLMVLQKEFDSFTVSTCVSRDC